MLEEIRATLKQEAQEILKLAERLDERFETAACWILACKGRIVTAGVGKAGDIAKKASSTFSSTGTPSFYLHASDALHGDLGMVTNQDLALLYSNSGETEEILLLIPALRQMGVKKILITGKPESTAAQNCELVLDVSVEREACPHNLAPTTSTTAMLAISDALALAVMNARKFTKDDYALIHPSGTLGKRLLLRVRDTMRKGEDIALVRENLPFLEVLRAITRAGAGAAIVVDDELHLLGLITDGDVRRHLQQFGEKAFELSAKDMMTKNPFTIDADALAVEAIEHFENLPRKIGEIPVLEEGRVVGIVMLKDLIRLGLR
ncbi:MAG TPA: KpsF/GutQ family sugar-phosphate isomerase [Fimbriimonadales bacterium]|nr:KpsF/GutQ family sugar-phosphate isomerase [Fimbriimonadales bacterium]